MTLDIAEIVSPGGQVFGIDSSPIQIEQALLLQKERAITNASFTSGSAYLLPYADGQFDVVFVHAVLYHLLRPEQALAEFRRVLKPGGIVALRDACHSGDMMMPMSTHLAAAWAVIDKVFTYQGGTFILVISKSNGSLTRAFKISPLAVAMILLPVRPKKAVLLIFGASF